MPEHEAQYYHQEFEAGRTIVTVTADSRAAEASAILRRHGAYDMSSRSSPAMTTPTFRKEVHTENQILEVPVQREEVIIERTPVQGRAATEGIGAGDIREGQEIRIPVREEQVNVSKDAVVTEEVKVGKQTVQDTARVSGQVRKEEVKVDQTGDVDVKNRGTGKGTNPA